MIKHVFISAIILAMISTESLADCRDKFENLLEAINDLDAEGNAAVAEANSLRGQLYHLRQQIHNWQRKHSYLINILRESTQQRQVLLSDRNNIQGELNFLANRFDPYALSRKSFLFQNVHKINNLLYGVDSRSAHVAEEIQLIIEHVSELRRFRKEYSDELATVSNRMDELWSKRMRYFSDLNHLNTPQGNLDCNKNELAQMSSKLRAAQSRLENLTNIRSDLKKVEEEQKNLNNELEEFINSIE